MVVQGLPSWIVADPRQSFDEFLGRTSPSGGQSYIAGPTGAGGNEGIARAAQASFDEFLGRPEGAPSQGPIPMQGTLREWYTGANLGGTENGWNTQFQHDYQTRYNQAIEEGRSYSYFQQDDAVGVVTWDSAGKDSRGNELKFGDVVSEGKRVGNVYEDFDRHTANLMMGDYLIQDGRVKARLSSGADEEAITGAWDREIETLRQNNNTTAELAPRAEEFEEDVEERVSDYGTAEEVGIAAMGAGGMAVMAAPLLAAGPAGWAGWAALTAGAGLASWLNQDSLKYQIGRNLESAERASEEGMAAGSSQYLGAFAQNFFLTALNPAVNMVQGLVDATSAGGVGGGDIGGAFYAVDDEGRRKVGAPLQIVENLARVADSVLTFASPAGKAMYTAQMGGQIASSVVGLVPGVGSWDERRLEMDSIWTDQDGNFDLASSAAGIANVGIEAVQLGGMRGLLGQANREAARVVPGREKLFTGEGFWTPVAERTSRVGLTREQREAVARGTAEIQSMAGYRFVVDKASGQLVGKQRGSLSMLAPSEAMQSLAAKHLARRDAASRPGEFAIRAEDIYQHANDLAVGEKRLHTILVNAFGEGTEEAAQGLLEPWSHQAAVDPEEVFRAAAAGFASGAGMGIAATWQRPSQADRMYQLGALAHGRNADGSILSRKDWDAMSALEQRRLVQQWSKFDEATMKGVWDRLKRIFKGEVNGRVVGAADFQDRMEKAFDAATQRGAPATDDSLVITQLDEARYRADGRLTSHTQFLRGMENRFTGMVEQRGILEEDLKEAVDDLRKDQGNERLQQRVAAVNDQIAELEAITEYAKQLLPQWQRRVEKIEAAFNYGNDAVAFGEIADLNRLVEKIFDRGFDEWNGETLTQKQQLQLAKAVSTVDSRYPQDTPGSWSVLVPLVDDYYSQTGTNGMAAISETQLASKRGDFDGDKISSLAQLMLDDEQYINSRTGAFRTGPQDVGSGDVGAADRSTPTVDIKTPDDELTITRSLAMAFQTTSTDPALGNLASNTFLWLDADFRDRYAPDIITHEVLNEIMTEVKKVMETTGGGDVRQAVLQQFAERAGAELSAKSRLDLTDEYVWLARTTSARLQEFQKAYAAITPLPGEQSVGVVSPAHYSVEQHERRASMAATKAAQVANLLAGSSMFRFFGKLHHTKGRSTEHTFDGYESDNLEFEAKVRYYEGVASNALKTKLETVHTHDPIMARVLVMLQREVAKSDISRLTHDMALAANTMVEQYRYEMNPATGRVEAKSTGKYVTMAQQFLYLSLQEYRKENARIWGTDPDVQLAYNKLFPLTQPPTQKLSGSTPANAERAFVEVFNSVPMYELLGDASITVGPQITVGQLFRRVKDMDPRIRREKKNALAIMGEYRGESENPIETLTVPYVYDDVEQRRVTAYRTVVDSVWSAASNEISISSDGTLTGRLAGDEARASESFGKAHRRVQDLLKQVKGKRGRRWTAQEIADLADENPDFGRMLYRAIPDSAYAAVFRGQDADGKPRFADWFFDVFAEQDTEKAEWMFLSNSILDQWRVLEANLDLDGDDVENKGVNYQRLTNRWHRVMFRLAVDAQGNPMGLQEFMHEMTKEGQTRENFLKWANTQQGYLAGGAPLLGWVADTAQFDADKAGSGWTAGATSTPQVLEAFENLHRVTDNLITGLQRSKNAKRDTLAKARAIRRYKTHLERQAGVPGPEVKLDKNDEVVYNEMMAAIKAASKRHLTYGPRAMLTNITQALNGVYGAHEKADNPAHLATAELLEVRDTHFAFQVLYDRLLGDLTAYDESDVAGNARLIMQDGGRMMTAEGREVTWEMQALDKVLPLMEEPKHHHLFNTLMQPQVVELDDNNRASTQFLLGNNPASLLSRDEVLEMIPDTGGRLSADQAFKFLSWLEGQILADGDPFVLQQKVHELAIKRTSALERPASWAELHEIATDAAIDYATWLQAAARTRPEQKIVIGPDRTEQYEEVVGEREVVETVTEQVPVAVEEAADLSLTPIPGEGEAAVDEMGRVFIVVGIDTAQGLKHIPYYRAAGGDWLPFFGFGVDGWVIKATNADNGFLRALTRQVRVQYADYKPPAKPAMAAPARAEINQMLQSDWGLGDLSTTGVSGGLAPADVVNDVLPQLPDEGQPLRKRTVMRSKTVKRRVKRKVPVTETRTRTVPGRQTTQTIDPAHRAHAELTRAMRLQANAEILGLDPENFLSLDLMRESMRVDILGKYDPRIMEGLRAAGLASVQNDPMRQQSADQYVEQQRALKQAELDRMDFLFDMDVHAKIRDKYWYSKDMPDDVKATQRQVLVDYARRRAMMLTAASESQETVGAIRHYYTLSKENWRDANPLQIGDADLEKLAREIISVELQHVVQVAIPENNPGIYPEATPRGEGVNEQKYWDYDFSFVLDVISPDPEYRVLEIAREALFDHGFTVADVTEPELVEITKQTILKEGTFGRWTDAMPIQMIESLKVLTGASAKPVVSMSGHLSRTHGAEILATRRTFNEVDPSLFSKVVLDWQDLIHDDLPKNSDGTPHPKAGLYHQVEVLHPTGPVQRPFQQLNNRFASELTFTYVDPATKKRTAPQSLMDVDAVARKFVLAITDTSIEDGGLRGVHMGRLRRHLVNMVQRGELPREALDTLEIEMTFVHPDTQPTESVWNSDIKPEESHYNSLWHEGTVYQGDGDYSFGLLSVFIFGNGGLNAVVQRAAIDTRKKGLLGLERYVKPGYKEVLDLEQFKGTDWADMLLTKTKVLMETTLTGKKKIDPDFFNAVYKMMKLRHWVEGVDEKGNRTKWTSEQVIQWQLANPGKDIFDPSSGFPLREAKMWVPSTSVLASMLGERGFGGVEGRLTDSKGQTTNLTNFPQFQGWSPQMEEKFPSRRSQDDISLLDTQVAKQSQMNTLVTRLTHDPAKRVLFQERQENWRLQRKAAIQKRAETQVRRGWNADEQTLRVVKRMDKALEAMDVRIDFPEAFRFLGMSQEDVVARTSRDVADFLSEARAQTDSLVTGWLFQRTPLEADFTGLLTATDLAKGRLELAPGDLVVFDVSSYRDLADADARVEAQQQLDQLISMGVAIQLVASKGKNGFTHELAHYIRTRHGYQRYANNASILVPDTMVGQRYANLEASASKLAEIRQVKAYRQRLSMLTDVARVTENSMFVPLNTRLNAIQTQFDLLPLDVAATFHVPQTEAQLRQVGDAIAGLRDNPEGLTRLAIQSLGLDKKNQEASLATRLRLKPKDKDDKTTPRFTKKEEEAIQKFRTDFNRMADRIEERIEQDTVLPLVGETFGTGDFIPVFGGGQMILYRHGHKFPENYQQKLLDNSRDAALGGQYIVAYGEPEDAASTHTGTVVGVDPSNKFGMRIQLDIPVSQMGQKIAYEYNGMKYVQTHLPSNFVVPEQPLLANVPIDGYASMRDAMSKEAKYGQVLSFQKAFAVFGWNFRKDVASFFGTSEGEAKAILEAIQAVPNKVEITEVARLQDLEGGQSAFVDVFSRIAGVLETHGVDRDTWTTRIYEDTFEATVVRAMIQYLMTPGANVDVLLEGTGLNIDDPNNPNALVTIPPELFTRVFDMAEPGGEVKQELERRINAAIPKGKQIRSGPNAGLREGWRINVDSWRLTSITEKGARHSGYLQFGEPHTTSDNPELNAQASARKQRQTNSMHTTLGSQTMLGAQVRTDPKKERKLKKMAEGMPPVPSGEGKLWKLFTHVDQSTMGPGTAWQQPFPLEWHHLNRSLDRFAQYRFAIPRDSNEEVWREYDARIEQVRNEIISMLGLRSSQGVVIDYWVRQLMYRPAPAPGQTDYADEFWPPHVLDAMQTIVNNLKDGYFPIYGGNGPTQISEADLNLLYQAAKHNGGKWGPYAEEGRATTKLTPDADYGDWISAAFGQAYNRDVQIDPVLLLDQDGFMNTYRQTLHERGRFLSLSFNPEIQQRLLDPHTNELITVTSSRDEKDRLTELVYLPAENISFEDLRRGIMQARDPAARKRGDGWRLAERKRVSRWRSKNKVRPMAATTGRNYVTHGNAVIDEQVNMHAPQRILLALRHGMAMLNPGLYLSALPEAGFRSVIAQTVNTISGTATSKKLGKITARTPWSAYTPETIDRLNKLYQEMGVNGSFTGLIIADMMYEQPSERMGRTVSFFENFARVGNLFQDPTWGTTQTAMARRYVEAVLQAVASTPISNSMTVEAVIGHLRANPKFFAESSNTGHKQIHEMAVRSVIEYRGLSQTLWSKAAKAIYEPMANSNRFGVRFIGTIAKMSLMYAPYNINILTSMAGLQGFNQAASLFMNNRRTPGTMANRMWKKMTFQEIDPSEDVRINLDSTLDGFTMANAFIKGGVTHTGLFLLGMMSANGLGLTGEDDEARRRRRLAEAQNAVFLADPRRLEADFRNKDAVFLDFLPAWAAAPFRVAGEGEAQDSRAMIQINWLLKPFLNPIIGMERFFQTGDFNEIVHAFSDAVGSLPLFNWRTYEDGIQTAKELEALAAEQQELGTPEALANTNWLLLNAVGTLERMLFENMFINSLYVGLDEYDRDPTKMLLRDSDGEVQRTIEGEPRENDLALTQYVDPETGEVSSAYMERSPAWAKVAAYTENNATAAAVASLFTGFSKDLWRTSQAVRIRDIDLPQIQDHEARAIVAAALNQMYEADGVDTRMFSLAEITANIKAEALKNQDWDTYNNLDAVAMQVFNDPNINPEYEPLSLSGPDGVERLTTPGAIAVVQGLLNGTVDLKSPSLRNIAISFEMREQIQAEMKDDTIQDGIDRGLTREQADKRWQRLFHGDFENPEVPGIKDVLWNFDDIPATAKAQYKQLNTTYVQGPDGYPWATGFKRGGFPGLGGFSSMFLGFKKPTMGMSNAMGSDGRLNSTDETRGINTGLRGLVPFYESELVETDIEQTDRIVEAIEKANESSGTYTPFTSGGGSGNGRGRFYRRYGGWNRRTGYRRSGYGGAGDYAPMIYWSKQYTLPRGVNLYGNKTSNIFWDNPTIRRHTIRRERTQSQRGRLNQWQ